MQVIQFADHLVPYDMFVEDVASRLALKLQLANNDPDIISQRKAFEMFGRGNVERWRRERKIQPYKRPGRLEYRTAELRYLQSIKQDYFKS